MTDDARVLTIYGIARICWIIRADIYIFVDHEKS